MILLLNCTYSFWTPYYTNHAHVGGLTLRAELDTAHSLICQIQKKIREKHPVVIAIMSSERKSSQRVGRGRLYEAFVLFCAMYCMVWFVFWRWLKRGFQSFFFWVLEYSENVLSIHFFSSLKCFKENDNVLPDHIIW